MKHLVATFAVVWALLRPASADLESYTTQYFPDSKMAAMAIAGATGKTDVLSSLISQGVSVNSRGAEGMTPLIWALLFQNKDGFKFLLRHGADPNLQLPEGASKLARVLPFAGNSAVSLAARNEDIWFLETVLANGGNVNIVNPFRHFTPIYTSVESRRIDNAKLLIKAGANLNFLGHDGVTPLIFAASSEEYDLAYEMLQSGADPTIKNRFGYTVVYYIHLSKRHRIMESADWRDKVEDLLRSKGIDIVNGR